MRNVGKNSLSRSIQYPIDRESVNLTFSIDRVYEDIEFAVDDRSILILINICLYERILPMINWSKLGAFGSAEDAPILLEQLRLTQSKKVLEELRELLLHQGSVSSAGLAALPSIVPIIRQWKPEDRMDILFLAVDIITGGDINSIRRPQVTPVTPEEISEWQADSDEFHAINYDYYQDEIAVLLILAEETLASKHWEERDFTYLLGAIIGLKENLEWMEKLNYLLWGFDRRCENCGITIDTYISENILCARFEMKDKKYIEKPIEPANRLELTNIPLWIYEMAERHKQPIVARWITCWFGSINCSQCGESFKISELYEAHN